VWFNSKSISIRKSWTLGLVLWDKVNIIRENQSQTFFFFFFKWKDNHIDDIGVKYLADAIENHRSLRKLMLDRNTFQSLFVFSNKKEKIKILTSFQ